MVHISPAFALISAVARRRGKILFAAKQV